MHDQLLRSSLLDRAGRRSFAMSERKEGDDVLKEVISKAAAEIEAVFATSTKKYSVTEKKKKAQEAAA